MNDVQTWLSQQGITIPTRIDVTQAVVALGLVIAALAIGWLAGAKLGPLLTDIWHRRVGAHAEGLSKRICTILRHGTAAVLLAIISEGWPWPPIAALGIGIALGAAAAAALLALLRGVGLARWMAWTVAALVFVALLSHAIGGLTPITATLDRIGFDVGKRRFSLLAGISVLVTIVVLYALVRIAQRAVGQAVLQARGLDPTQRLLAQKLASIALITLAFFFGVDLLGIDLTSFAVFSGAFGLAIGFGLQKTIGNLIAGIILLMDRSVKPGDVIVVGDKEVGWVNKIGVRAVSIITRDGKEHLIPNENLMTQEVENWSYSDRNVRVRIPVIVAYDCDLKLAQELMLRAAGESPRVLDQPPTNVWLTKFGENGIEHEILAWISDPEAGVGNVRSDVLNRLWVLFKDHGVIVPYPRRDVRLVAGEVGAAGSPD